MIRFPSPQHPTGTAVSVNVAFSPIVVSVEHLSPEEQEARCWRQERSGGQERAQLRSSLTCHPPLHFHERIQLKEAAPFFGLDQASPRCTHSSFWARPTRSPLRSSSSSPAPLGRRVGGSGPPISQLSPSDWTQPDRETDRTGHVLRAWPRRAGSLEI